MATKEELLNMAKELDIEGRSGMSKAQLEEAVASAEANEEPVEVKIEEEVEEEAEPEVEVEPEPEPEPEDEEEAVADGNVRILGRFWDRILRERDNRPSAGDPDLLSQVIVIGDGGAVEMPVDVARAFGVHPSLYG